MPDGAQAWKMIKTPGSHTDRIAQACDRCRSKKIRCDGKRPHCSQCAAVGFECKTSDKLSRRAFPRGYTESLEDRVRQLESENNKLLNLLDIKDEQMEMLAKVESVSTTTTTTTPTNVSPSPNTSSPPKKLASLPPKHIDIHNEDANEEEAYVVHQINTLSEQGTYKGSAAGGVFIDAFLEKLRTKNTTVSPLVTTLFEHVDEIYHHTSLHSPSSPDTLPTPASMSSPTPSLAPHNSPSSFYANLAFPNRMSSDKLTATYFHEWNSMFAVLDQYAYLEEYQTNISLLATAEVTGNYDALKGKEMFFVVALLVLALGSLASKDKSTQAMVESNKLEQDWKRMFTSQMQNTPSLDTVQALVLAELYSLHTGNKNDIWHYRMLAVSMTQRLGLHRCHKSLKLHNGNQLSFYDQEMRRRCFWVAYSLDCFSAAQLGAPRLFNDEDIECALPSNIDDELLLHGEKKLEEKADAMTQMSCPLSVIHFSKCLANILQTIYSSVKKTHPYKTVVTLEDQLESWRRELPTDLKFDFANGAPTAVLAPVHQKSPLLFMFYHYARILIHMPAVSAPSLGINTGTRGSASCVAVMQSAKVLIQVGNYLKHRSVIPTVPMNPSRSYVFFGMLVLYGAIDYSKGGALLLDIKKTMSSAMSHLYSDLQLKRPGSLTPESYQRFEEICDSLLNVNNRKNSTSEDEVKPKAQRKRRTSTKSTKQQQVPTAIATPLEEITPPAQHFSSSPAESTNAIPTSSVANDKLRENAINDLLFLNSIMSNTSKEDRWASSQTKNESFGELPIDMFDFVTRPYSGQSGGLINSDNMLFLNSPDQKHEPHSDLLEFLSYGSWNEDRSVISNLIQ